MKYSKGLVMTIGILIVLLLFCGILWTVMSDEWYGLTLIGIAGILGITSSVLATTWLKR